MHKKYTQLPLQAQEDIQCTLDITNGVQVALKDNIAHQYRALMRMNFSLCDAIYSQNNHVDLFLSAKEKYDALFEDIRNAKESIHLLYFIIANNDIGHRLLKLLCQKAREGVQVRVIYDELGSITTPNHMFSDLRKAGGEVYRFFPLRFGTLLHANYRNHRKIAILDGQIAYTGGMNIGDEYLGLHPRKSPWRDTHLRISGNSVYSLQMLFLLDLYYATEDEQMLMQHATTPSFFPVPKKQGDIGMQIVHSGPDQESAAIKRAMVEMIHTAKKSVYVQSPYLMPDDTVLMALQNAAKAGIDVVVMLPGVPDKRTVYCVTTSYIENLLDYGVHVFLYNGFLHSKMLVVDDAVCTIGTCNLDMRSFQLHFEVNCFIYDSGFSKTCSEAFVRDLADCRQVSREEYLHRGLFKKFWERLLRLFAPLM